MPGYFITIEGIEGCGKSTQCNMLSLELESRGIKNFLTMEPGGSITCRKIREIILHSGKIFPLAELFLFLADRNQHINEIIKPLLEAGTVVICDRYYHSTYAYQSAGRGIENGLVKNMNEIAMESLEPDITFIIDIPVERGLERKNSSGGKPDRIENEEKDFHERVRESYLKMADYDKKTILINGERPKVEIHDEITAFALEKIKSKNILE